MNLREFQFPKLNAADVAFSTLNTNADLLNEAKARGFLHGHTPYNGLFNELFFNGGELNFKTDLPHQFKADATIYLRAFMASFSPKHEHKEAICAMLLSELVEAN